MATKRKVGNLLALAVLSYLSRAPMHPYEFSRTLRSNGDARSIKYNPGSVYMVFQQLAKAGFIEEQEKTREGQRPERTVYALTSSGRDELHSWMLELVAEPVHEYPQFVTALSLIGALAPDEAVDLLRRRLERLERTKEEARSEIDRTLASGVPPLFLVEEEYRLNLLTAEIEYVAGLVARITDPETGWYDAWAAAHQAPGPS